MQRMYLHRCLNRWLGEEVDCHQSFKPFLEMEVGQGGEEVEVDVEGLICLI